MMENEIWRFVVDTLPRWLTETVKLFLWGRSVLRIPNFKEKVIIITCLHQNMVFSGSTLFARTSYSSVHWLISVIIYRSCWELMGITQGLPHVFIYAPNVGWARSSLSAVRCVSCNYWGHRESLHQQSTCTPPQRLICYYDGFITRWVSNHLSLPLWVGQ